MNDANVRRRLRVCGEMLALLALASGCAAPTPQQIDRAKRNRLEAEHTLLLFQNAVAARNASDAAALLSPAMAGEDRTDAAAAIGRAVMLRRYRSYKLDIVDALDGVGLWSWLDGRAKATIQATNADDVSFDEYFVLQRQGSRWLITRLEMSEVDEGELVELSPAEEAQIRAFTVKFLDDLKEKRFGSIVYAFPQEGQERTVKPGLWARLMGTEAFDFSLAQDLMIVNEFSFVEYPKVENPLPLFYLPGNEVGLVLWGRYKDSLHGSSEIETISFSLVFSKQGDEWKPFSLRVKAAELP